MVSYSLVTLCMYAQQGYAFHHIGDFKMSVCIFTKTFLLLALKIYICAAKDAGPIASHELSNRSYGVVPSDA